MRGVRGFRGDRMQRRDLGLWSPGIGNSGSTFRQGRGGLAKLAIAVANGPAIVTPDRGSVVITLFSGIERQRGRTVVHHRHPDPVRPGVCLIGQLLTGYTGGAPEIVAQAQRVSDLVHDQRLQCLPDVESCGSAVEASRPSSEDGSAERALLLQSLCQTAQAVLSVGAAGRRILG